MRKEEHGLAESPKLGTGDRGTRVIALTPLILFFLTGRRRLKMPLLPTSGGEGSNIISKKNCLGEFPGGLVVRTRHFPCCGPASIPAWGTKIPQAVWHGQKNKIKLC